VRQRVVGIGLAHQSAEPVEGGSDRAAGEREQRPRLVVLGFAQSGESRREKVLRVTLFEHAARDENETIDQVRMARGDDEREPGAPGVPDERERRRAEPSKRIRQLGDLPIEGRRGLQRFEDAEVARQLSRDRRGASRRAGSAVDDGDAAWR
jgi:hypothetical protein